MLQALVEIPTYTVIGSSKDRIVYYSDEGGTLVPWSLDPLTGDRLKLESEPVAGQVWAIPRRTTNDFYYLRDVAKGAEKYKIFRTSTTDGGETLAVDVPDQRVSGFAFCGDMVGFTASSKEASALYTSKSGSIEKRADVGGFTFVNDLDAQYLAGMGVLAGNSRTYELFFYDLGKGEMKIFTPNEGSVNKGPFLRGPKALFESNLSGANELYVHDIESGETTPAPMGSPDHDAYHPTEHLYFDWTENGRVFCVGKKDGQARAFVDGKEVKTPPGYLTGLALYGGKVYVSHSTFVQPFRVLAVDLESGDIKTVIDNPISPFLRERFVRSRLVRYRSGDGKEIAALVADDGTTKPRRTITYIHGGPWGEVPDAWSILPASFVAFGYNVIAPNYRGSTGYGEDFRTMDIGDPGGMDFVDMVFAAKWAKENLATDIALAGYSYGGYSTLYGLGREPELWACGVAGAPVADWKEMYETSDSTFRSFMEILFDKKMELLPERSPITYAKNVRRPLCIVTSQNDSRTPMMPVLRYAMMLQESGAKFELHSIPDMGHTIRTTKDVMDIVYPMIMFLQREFPPTVSTVE